jgi:mRNA deadenylase 3'-5' endonuclease subunit Ccr4
MLVNIAMNNHVIGVLIEPICSGGVSPAQWMDEWNKLQDFRWGNSSPGSGEEELEEVQEAIASIQLTGRSVEVRSRTEEHRSSVDTSADVDGVTSHPRSNDVDSMRHMITHRLGLINASGLPEYTNYTADFKDTLDYVMASKHCFQVVRVAPFPPESVLCEHIALPSEVFPSDHIAVAVDVEWMDMK